MDEQKMMESVESNPSVSEPQGLNTQDFMIMLHDIVYIVSAVALVFMFFFRLVTVEGDSMYPTLCNQDRVIMLGGIWYDEPAAGDIVVARAPEFSEDSLIKRIVAVAGDVVDIDFQTGAVSVNGELLQQETLPEPVCLDFKQSAVDFPMQVDDGCVFLLGDNMAVSYDSRYRLIGQVDQRNILGRVIYLAFPGCDHISGQRELGRIGWMK